MLDKCRRVGRLATHANIENGRKLDRRGRRSIVQDSLMMCAAPPAGRAKKGGNMRDNIDLEERKGDG